jgi:hypothetical protein
VVCIGSGCKKGEIYPDIPSIEFKSYYFTSDPLDSSTKYIGIIFSYKDGDGDIGLNPEDTLPPYNSVIGPNNVELNPYYNNLRVDYLALKDGEFQPVIIPNTTDSVIKLARIQNITPDGKHKAIRGDIDYWGTEFVPFEGVSKTIRLRIKIYDRALHQSNTIESPVITLP